MRIALFVLLILSFSSCEFIRNTFGGKEKPIARVYDLYLYPTDIQELVPKGTDPNDSILLVQSYIENWIRQNVLLKQAEENVELNLTEIDEQLENYRQSLIIYSYEQQLVGQKLDTNVSKAEVKKYYEQNKDNFELKQSILKASYIKLPKNAPRVALAKKWFVSTKSKDREELETYCMQFAPEYSLVDTNWLLLDDLSIIIPLNRLSESSILQSNNFIELSDAEFFYLVKVKDFMYKEDFSPLEFEEENIRNIIINKRKVELINKMENDVYQKARDNKDVEIYKED